MERFKFRDYNSGLGTLLTGTGTGTGFFSPEPKIRTGKQDRKIFDPNFKQENRTGFFYRKQDLITGNRTGNCPSKFITK